MKTYEMHRLADIVPPMTTEEFAELKADIKAHGLREPVTLLDGKILDGKHRYRACRELGVSVTTREFPRNDGQPVDFVISENVKRRHLTTGQKAAVAHEARPTIERELAEEKRPPTKTGGEHKHQAPATIIAAQRVGVQPSRVEEYATLIKDTPDLAKQVRSGDIGLGTATVERMKRRARVMAKKEVAKAKTKKRQEDPREVKSYLEACRVFCAEVKQAVDVAEYGKFSPEAQRFVRRRHDDVRALLRKLEDAFNG
jgi:ParB-like chromosome segregation protein Spo0J